MSKKIVLESLDNIPKEYQKIRSSIKLTIISFFSATIIMFIIGLILVIKQTSKIFILDTEKSQLLTGSLYSEDDKKVIEHELKANTERFLNFFYNINKINYKYNMNQVVNLGGNDIFNKIDHQKTTGFFKALEEYNVFQQYSTISDFVIDSDNYPYKIQVNIEVRLVGDISSYNLTKKNSLYFEVVKLSQRTKENPHRFFINTFKENELK